MKLISFGLLGFLAATAVGVGTGVPAAVADETITMVTTGKGSAQQWPIFIAITKGYMAENNVALDLIAAPSTALAMQQIAAGSANLASGGLTDPLLEPADDFPRERFAAAEHAPERTKLLEPRLP